VGFRCVADANAPASVTGGARKADQ
jgi:hypothetical protein